ncbi:hypothetical protein RHMOL_Rhmol07G0111900 [Rhododendron molle]|uniref:Uncharacterized protein n=1 Tax=Rhododendron molle TaxID=49168 RepID=A0ACC0MZN9_RHOML|nr:hypothetical protein RHMOL_Rhmol07G0111900 [Rhododendron molle]
MFRSEQLGKPAPFHFRISPRIRSNQHRTGSRSGSKKSPIAALKISPEPPPPGHHQASSTPLRLAPISFRNPVSPDER